jgi:hypothetical protein
MEAVLPVTRQRAVRIPDGTLEALKWIAAALMLGDHVNKYLLAYGEPVLFALGRLSLPLFVFVLAYNLARPERAGLGHSKTLWNLAAFGVVAQIIVQVLRESWTILPLNILFTLWLLTAAVASIEATSAPRWQHVAKTAALVILGGAFVEFWWPAVLGGLAAWWYSRTGSGTAMACSILACASLFLINGNGWSLAAIPLIALAMHLPVRVPRLRWFFYAFYPAHLLLMGLIKPFVVPSS